jgi:hypothetical protein
LPKMTIGVIWFAVGVVVGAATTYVWQERAPRWQLGTFDQHEGAPGVWRLDTRTGLLEGCTAGGGTPHCVTMPKPADRE